MRNRFVKTTMLGAFLVFILGATPSHAQTPATDKVAKFYKGKTITWVVSAEPGGPTDVIARILVPHVGKETGTKILVKNMTGGSMEGDNWTFNEGKRDGLTVLTEVTGALMLNDMLKSPGVQYTTEKFNFLTGVVPELCVAAVSPKAPYKTFDAVRKAKGIKVGASSAKGYIAVSGAITSAILGLDAKVITGYQGMKSVLLAVAQGEMDMVIASEPDIVLAGKNGDVVPIFVVSGERSSLMPNIPTMKELGVTVPKELDDAYRTIASNTRAVALPPGVPAERVAYLRGVFNKLSMSKEVQDDMSRYNGVRRPFVPGDKLQEEINSLKANKVLAAQMEGIMKKYSAAR
jgi:tripartite-type tricarboxylate transporter receptor subunit TctC